MNQVFGFKQLTTVAALVAVLFVTGCGPSIPDIVPAKGNITFNGKPLYNVEVRFVPTQDGLDGNMIASGLSDKEGNFVMKLPGKSESGCCVGEAKVLILEGEMPDEIRGDESDQMAATKFLKSLGPRPDFNLYKIMNNTPLSVTVTKDKTEYNFELDR